MPNESEEEVNLEHVLPLRPEGNWPEFEEEAAQAMRRRIGNLVLLQQRLNSALKSAPFSDKRLVLAASQFQLTAEVGALPDWNEMALEDRQRRLAGLAVRAWPAR